MSGQAAELAHRPPCIVSQYRCNRTGEIVRTAMSLSTADPDDLGSNSVLLERDRSAVRRAGETFLANLDAITVKQICETAEKTHVLDDEKAQEVAMLSDELGLSF